MIRKIFTNIGWNLRMPWWLFWSFLAALTWFYIVRRIISWDLWWHLAAGRYLDEHGLWSAIFNWRTWLIGGEYLKSIGVYPDNRVFTFSPVTDTGFISRTWLGDIIFYKIYEYGGFYGLQIFRGTLILIPVVLMLHLTRWKLNIWTLFACTVMIVGTMQKHLCKNAIVSLPFMAFICWAWIQARYRGKTRWLWTYPFLFLFWSHYHGEVIVGLYLLGAIVAGEILDALCAFFLPYGQKITWRNLNAICTSEWVILVAMLGVLMLYFLPIFLTASIFIALVICASFPFGLKPFFEYFKTRRPSLRLGLTIICSSLLCLIPVHVVWGIPTDSVTEMIAKLVPSIKGPQAVEQGAREEAAKNKAEQAPQDIKVQLKKILRTVFTGFDADMVSEYQWPFEILYVLSVKAVFLIFVLYFAYFLLRITLGLRDFCFAIELPCLMLIYMSMGYLRTVSFTFVVALPFMAYGLVRGFQMGDVRRRRLAGMMLLSICLALIGIHNFSDTYKGFNTLFFNCLGYAQILAVPFMLLPLFLGAIFLIKDGGHFKLSISVLSLFMGIYTLACLGAFAYYSNKTYQNGNFQEVSGFIDTEPGLGKSNKFFDGIADYVTQNLPPHKNIYNTYNMGGYLQWIWYGQRKVFIDGRSAIFEPNFYQAYIQNNAQDYIRQHDFDHAFLNHVVDKDRLIFFLQQGWTPIAYDSASAVLQKPQGKIDSVYGLLPKYILGERSIAASENYDQEMFGHFINATINHMMLFGRIKDATSFMEQTLPLIEQMRNEALKQQLKNRMVQLQQIGGAFGNINHAALGALCKKLFDNVQGLAYHVVIADTFFALGHWAPAEAHYRQAYQLNKDELQVLLKIGETTRLQNKLDQSKQAFEEARVLKMKLEAKNQPLNGSKP